MLEGADSRDDRLVMRRERRWRRRGRIAAPFLAVPVMLGLLLLSVDLIEYQPSTDADPAKSGNRDASPASPTRPAAGPSPIGLEPDFALSVSVVESPLSGAIAPSASERAIDRLAAWPGTRASAVRP
jgi:hypothetical protein